MLRLALILGIAAVACGSPSNHVTARKGSDGRIVGGFVTDISKRPYQVCLSLSQGLISYMCGGSILSETKVLTAAHCVYDGPRLITVRAGSNYCNRGGVSKSTPLYTYHPQFNRVTLDNDVAIVDLRLNPLTFTNVIKPVNLAAMGTSVADGTPVVVSGWGTTSENGNTSDRLMEVSVFKTNQESCNSTYGNITPRMLCAGVPEGGKDSCQGDSGGPLVLASNNTQVGIVSFGYGCARPGVPGVYSNVAALRSWIASTAGV